MSAGGSLQEGDDLIPFLVGDEGGSLTELPDGEIGGFRQSFPFAGFLACCGWR